MDRFKDGKSLFVIDKLQKSTDLIYFGVVHIKNMLSREKGNYNFFSFLVLNATTVRDGRIFESFTGKSETNFKKGFVFQHMMCCFYSGFG